MPWSIEKRGDQYCVVKQGETSPVPGGCHPSRAKARAHQRALYANEPSARSASLDSVVASVAPLKPPKDWFFRPEANRPTPITIEADGRLYGHLYLWGECHTGFSDECVVAPRSRSNYAYFHLGQLETEEGDMLAVGKMTYDGPHASLHDNLQAASRHYDHTGHVGAFVRAVDGNHGIWLSGVLKSDITPEGLRDLRANPPSGDWRNFRHSLELVAALAVPVPGFPVKRELALAASGEVQALIMSEPAEERGPRRNSRAYLRERAVVASMINAPKMTRRQQRQRRARKK